MSPLHNTVLQFPTSGLGLLEANYLRLEIIQKLLQALPSVLEYSPEAIDVPGHNSHVAPRGRR